MKKGRLLQAALFRKYSPGFFTWLLQGCRSESSKARNLRTRLELLAKMFMEDFQYNIFQWCYYFV